jgi:arginine exporter protein ArgO
MTILSFAAVFAGLGMASTSSNYRLAMVLVLGVFTGSALWWLMLSGCISLFRNQVTPRRLQWVNRISGVLMTMFGLVALLSLKG